MSKFMILGEVADERERQDKLWKEQNHSPEFWLTILTEEVGEVAKEICNYHSHKDNEDSGRQQIRWMRGELIQVSAVAVAFIESLDRNELK